MTSDVVLTAALRNNLLSLQNTQGLIDTTQLRLATGLKVNSALDNPQNFFAASALNNRASDLQRLLDGIGQNIQVIKAADNGITALTKLVEQADSVAQSARDVVSQGSAEARAAGDKDLSGISDITSLSGVNNGDTLAFTVIDPEDDTLITLNDAGFGAGVVQLSTNDSIEQIITQINDLNQGVTDGPVIEASLDADGQLEVRTLNGGDFQIDFVTGGDTDAENLALAEAFGFGSTARIVQDGAAANNVQFTASASTALASYQFFTDATQTTRASRSDLLEGLFDESGTQVFSNVDTAGTADDVLTISIDGGTTINIDLSSSIQSLIDDINNDASLSALIEADFDEDTSQITIRAVDPEVQDIRIGIESADAAVADFGFGASSAAFQAIAAGDPIEETIRFGAGAARLAELENDFDTIRAQIDELVTNGDTGYRGTNLLNGDDLVTFFNEFRSSSLTTEGVTFNSAGLGLTDANFADAGSIDAQLTQVRAALESVRNFGTTLANDLAIIQTREDFTNSLINTLTEGADKLTVADQNEEGAKLLALQTRQQLGVTSLSLASQSQQSILRLF